MNFYLLAHVKRDRDWFQKIFKYRGVLSSARNITSTDNVSSALGLDCKSNSQKSDSFRIQIPLFDMVMIAADSSVAHRLLDSIWLPRQRRRRDDDEDDYWHRIPREGMNPSS